MKIAVCYSGLVTCSEATAKKNIEHLKEILDESGADVDFFCTTWKGRGEYDFIDEYFEEPTKLYNTEIQFFKECIQNMRKVIAEEGYWELFNHKKFKLWSYIISYEGRQLGRNRCKQQLIHALTFKKFVEGNKYDIVIRTRYDAVFLPGFKELLYEAIDLCYDKLVPVGFGDFGSIPETKQIILNKQTSTTDFLIVHNARKFDPNYVFELFNKKVLLGAEAGWWQILAQRFSKPHYIVQGVVGLIRDEI